MDALSDGCDRGCTGKKSDRGAVETERHERAVKPNKRWLAFRSGIYSNAAAHPVWGLSFTPHCSATFARFQKSSLGELRVISGGSYEIR